MKTTYRSDRPNAERELARRLREDARALPGAPPELHGRVRAALASAPPTPNRPPAEPPSALRGPWLGMLAGLAAAAGIALLDALSRLPDEVPRPPAGSQATQRLESALTTLVDAPLPERLFASGVHSAVDERYRTEASRLASDASRATEVAMGGLADVFLAPFRAR
jgi:hypothetical protein